MRIDANGSWWLSDAWNWTKEKAIDAWDWTTQAASDAWGWTTQVASDAWNWITKAANNTWNWIKQAANNTWNWISRAADNTWKWMKQAWTNVCTWVGNAVDFVKEVLKTKAGRIVKNIVGIVWGIAKSISSLAIALGVAAVPVPVISQGAALGFAAKAGYHFESARRSLADLINVVFFEN